jgi:hypothetical protein
MWQYSSLPPCLSWNPRTPSRRLPAPRAHPDRHWLGQDLHRGQLHLSPRQIRRGAPSAVSSSPPSATAPSTISGGRCFEYFDASLIGLTATPSKQTFGFFQQNLVMEYNHEKAVADGVNVGCDIYRINTAITQSGSKVEAGFFVDKRDRQTRKVRWEQLDEVLAYDASPGNAPPPCRRRKSSAPFATAISHASLSRWT